VQKSGAASGIPDYVDGGFHFLASERGKYDMIQATKYENRCS